MGFYLEMYDKNHAGLIVSFEEKQNNEIFCSSNSIEEAMAYFDLYLDKNNNLCRRDTNLQILDALAIKSNEVENFKQQLKNITKLPADEKALDYILLFANWSVNKTYEEGERVRYGGILYKCLQTHNSQIEYSPKMAPSLWAQILKPQSWETNIKYPDGAQVVHNEIIYESQIDNNIWEPGAVGTDSVWLIVSKS